MVTELLSREPSPRLVLDPFGSSPDLVIEAVRSGRPVLVGANNPVTRFVLMSYLDPIRLEDLQKALAAIGDIAKDTGRLEDFMLDLYSTTCAHCGGSVTADYFVWEAEAKRPVEKAYVCPHCARAAEDPTTELDIERAASFDRRGLQRALAVGKVAEVGDPLREQAEGVLEVYPARAIYALMTLVTKIDTLPGEQRRQEAVSALLLSACDAADSLWAHPEGRQRPKQLTASPRFRELNLWRAMERAVRLWSRPSLEVEVLRWPEDGLPEDGQAALFPGPLKELSPTLPEAFNAFLLTVPPRPNQAFWSLSTLWAAWIWGAQAAEPVKASLRRKRYDWGWHASALRIALSDVVSRMLPSVEQQALLPESEPGFQAACLAAWDACGWRADGSALRTDTRAARMRWRSKPADAKGAWNELLSRAMRETLLARGEPTVYDQLHLSAWSALARAGHLAHLWEVEKQSPVTLVNHALRDSLVESDEFLRLDERLDYETGLYWVKDEGGAAQPLSDRVELAVAELLREGQTWDSLELDRRICQMYPGALTPDASFVQACLGSYAVRTDQGEWKLRPEDEPVERRQDEAEIAGMLGEIGKQLGFEVDVDGSIVWLDHGAPDYQFQIQTTAILPRSAGPRLDGRVFHVIPGGRASLFAVKAERDPRMSIAVDRMPGVIKYRHIRRLAEDTTLKRTNLDDRLAIDPPGHSDPQLPLL